MGPHWFGKFWWLFIESNLSLYYIKSTETFATSCTLEDILMMILLSESWKFCLTMRWIALRIKELCISQFTWVSLVSWAINYSWNLGTSLPRGDNQNGYSAKVMPECHGMKSLLLRRQNRKIWSREEWNFSLCLMPAWPEVFCFTWNGTLSFCSLSDLSLPFIWTLP